MNTTTFRVGVDPDGPGWQLEQDQHYIGTFMIRHDAVIRAVLRARACPHAMVVVLDRDGSVASTRSYDAGSRR